MPPPGTYAVLTGLGSTVGAALTASPLADVVSMTGSVATGKAIMRACAENMTKVSLELGGKAPAIVCRDADLDLAVRAVVASRVASLAGPEKGDFNGPSTRVCSDHMFQGKHPHFRDSEKRRSLVQR